MKSKIPIIFALLLSALSILSLLLNASLTQPSSGGTNPSFMFTCFYTLKNSMHGADFCDSVNDSVAKKFVLA